MYDACYNHQTISFASPTSTKFSLISFSEILAVFRHRTFFQFDSKIKKQAKNWSSDIKNAITSEKTC